MALTLVNVYVLLRHGKTIPGPTPNDPAYGKQYKTWIDTSTTTGKDLALIIAGLCGAQPLKRYGDQPALYYFSNVAPLEKPEGTEFVQTAQQLRVRGLPNLMDIPSTSGVPIWEVSLLAEKQVSEAGLIFCQTFRYRY
ncbi:MULTISPECIES: hypothetical protein [Pseudomonas]|jgi:hypothetical protein|uniref:hypothetical protein n=1 Tax=Pseudomonas TaxID=286 RepID=UPI001231E688|nr:MULTISPECIES: hypothetical protein [Pseudomonas]KAA6192367.1 hypothetical protein F3K52_25865 [Pseudomonas lactis]